MQPLNGVRVLDLTRVRAGPVTGRTLAAYGADIMLINSPNLPNISAIAKTSRGKLSAYIDLGDTAGRETPTRLLNDAHVFIQGYRPGGLEALGFGPQEAAQKRPASSTFRYLPAATRARGKTGAVSNSWCKLRWATTTPKDAQPMTPNQKRCACKSSNTRPVI
jgi:hypothetical protein